MFVRLVRTALHVPVSRSHGNVTHFHVKLLNEACEPVQEVVIKALQYGDFASNKYIRSAVNAILYYECNKMMY